MKKFSAILMLCVFCAFGAMADNETQVRASRVIPTAAQAAPRETIDRNVTNNTVVSRTAISRNVADTTPRAASGEAAPPPREPASSGEPQVRGTTSARTATASRASAQRSSGAGIASMVPQSGRNARVEAASINANSAVRRAGLTLRPSTAEVGGRATIGDTGIQTGSNVGRSARTVAARAGALNAAAVSEAQERISATNELNKSCQAQYNDCMDQFCMVIDANQKRCSCSSNLTRYQKVESAVKEANTKLNEVAQRIRYVGLSADEIRAIMSATEAEQVLSGSVDNTQSRGMLTEIEKLIRNPSEASSATTTASNSNFGLDLDIDSIFSGGSTSDIFNLDFMGINNSASSFAKLRGTDLYNAAAKRCATILTTCKDAGATSDQITGNYELAMDKDCIAYEKGLDKMNESLLTNVRSANNMLQKARLAVMQNKNQYDAKGCVAALNTCMADDMVCGSDYFKCIDPTKRYIDENGEVILGQNISFITAFMESYNNAAIDKTFLGNAYKVSIDPGFCKGKDGNSGQCIVKYLLDKIGMGETSQAGGLCRAVLDKCQRYSYDNGGAGKYNPYNDIVVNYVQRAMTNIKAAQQKIISEYASTCMLDLATCYNQQVSQISTWSSSASASNIYNVMRGACRNVSLTCAFAVFANDTTACPEVTNTITGRNDDKCINSISNLFYQSMLCPENSIKADFNNFLKGIVGTKQYYITGTDSPNPTTMSVSGTGPFINEQCYCAPGYNRSGNACVEKCPGTLTACPDGNCMDVTACPTSAGGGGNITCKEGYVASPDGKECGFYDGYTFFPYDA